MKQIICILPILILTSCRDVKSEPKITTATDTTVTHQIANVEHNSSPGGKSEDDNRRESLSAYFKKATLFKLTDTIAADFNGDKILDKAFL
jgi:hypothetical protein